MQSSSFHPSLMPYSPWHPTSTTCTDSPFGILSTNFLYSTVTWIQITHHLNFQINIGEIPNITVCHYAVHVINKTSKYCLETQFGRRLRLRPQQCHSNQLRTMTLSDCFTYTGQCNAQQSYHNAQCMQ